MCEPLMIAGAVAMAGSQLANMQAQRRVDKARRGAQEAESIRQQQLDRESQALNTQSQDRYQDYEGQQDDKTAEIAQFYGDKRMPEDAPSAIPSSGGNVTVARESAKQQGKARAYGDQQNEALAGLRAFGDLLGGIARDQSRDAGQIGLINSFKQGSAAVLPYELEAANAKGNSLRTLGSLLQGVGAGAFGAGQGGFSAPTMTPPGVPQQSATGITIRQNANAGVNGLPRFGLR